MTVDRVEAWFGLEQTRAKTCRGCSTLARTTRTSILPNIIVGIEIKLVQARTAPFEKDIEGKSTFELSTTTLQDFQPYDYICDLDFMPKAHIFHQQFKTSHAI